MVTYMLKTIFLMCLLLNVSYFFGLTFLKFIDLEEFVVTEFLLNPSQANYKEKLSHAFGYLVNETMYKYTY